MPRIFLLDKIGKFTQRFSPGIKVYILKGEKDDRIGTLMPAIGFSAAPDPAVLEIPSFTQFNGRK